MNYLEALRKEYPVSAAEYVDTGGAVSDVCVV